MDDGLDFSLIISYYVKSPLSLIVASDTAINLRNNIRRSDNDCEQITAAQLLQCIMERVESNLLSLNMSCLPFQVHFLFPILRKLYPQCENETEALENYLRVSSGLCLDPKPQLIKNKAAIHGSVAACVNI